MLFSLLMCSQICLSTMLSESAQCASSWLILKCEAKVPNLWFAMVLSLKKFLKNGKESHTVIRLEGKGILNRIKKFAKMEQSKANPLWYTNTTGLLIFAMKEVKSRSACLIVFE